MKNTHEEIYLFLQGKSEKGLEIISNIFFKQLYSQSYISLTKQEEPEDIFMDFINKIFEKRTFLLQKFENQSQGLASYIRQMAKNFLKDKLKIMSEIQFESVNNYERLISTDKNEPIKQLIKIEGFRFAEIIDSKFKEEEILILCYITATNKKDFEEKYLKDLSKDAIYKRVERVKRKLRGVISDFGYSQEAVRFYIENILPSKCKRGYENE